MEGEGGIYSWGAGGEAVIRRRIIARDPQEGFASCKGSKSSSWGLLVLGTGICGGVRVFLVFCKCVCRWVGGGVGVGDGIDG